MPKRGSGKQKKGGSQAERQRQQQAAQTRRREAVAPRVQAARDQRNPSAARAQQATPAVPEWQRPERWYVDISAVRIQEWLARTPDLKFRRGASVLLSEATAEDEWEKHLPAGTEWNPEAGSVDGVVTLVMTGDGADEEASRREVAREVAEAMRAKMPSIHIQAVAGRGKTYADAYQDMARTRRDGTLLVDLPPAPSEVIVAKPCDQCRSATAVHEKVVVIKNKVPGERDPDLCEECNQRLDAAEGTKGDHRPPYPERRMKAAIEAEPYLMRVRGFSDNFAKMAEGGRLRKDDASTQLALIYADGNRVGDFLHQAAQRAVGKKADRIKKSEIVKLIDEATIGALASAVADRFRDWERPQVLANVAGGDDLLISVPAADAWMFTRTLLASFGRKTAEDVGKWQVDIAPPTLSAGLVFAHKMHPFSDLVRLVGAELHKAKRHDQGKIASVSFLDLTADGGHAPAGREPLTLAYLDTHAADLERIEQISRSRRESLLALLRRGAVEDAIRRLTDLDGNQPLWDVITGKKDATPDEVREKLTSAETGEAALKQMRRLLDVARHWRTQPREETRTAARHEDQERR